MSSMSALARSSCELRRRRRCRGRGTTKSALLPCAMTVNDGAVSVTWPDSLWGRERNREDAVRRANVRFPPDEHGECPTAGSTRRHGRVGLAICRRNREMISFQPRTLRSNFSCNTLDIIARSRTLLDILYLI